MNVALESPLLSSETIRTARRQALAHGHPLLAALEEITGQSPRRLLEDIATLTGLSTADALAMQEWRPAFDVLPLTEAIQRECLLFHDGARLVAVIPDAFDQELQLWIESRAGLDVDYRLALTSDIGAYLSRQEESFRAIESITTTPAPEASTQRVEQLSLRSISADDSPVVRLVNSTLYDALRTGASDIHIETGRTGIVIKYRVDGVLDTVSTQPGVELAEQAISRIKVMSELDIAERRIPQDGRFKIAARGRDIDIRVSIMPSIHGEDAVLRILDKHAIIPEGANLGLDLLGFDTVSLGTVRHLAAQPYGMLLVTGPTGSGKTTTLYAAIAEINHGRDKIITIEDPVEYELPGVLQIPVNEKKGLTFAKGLRSILRHDPDKIMVGEIRDAETAEIAVQSALTGHLVLTTVHANNAFDVFNRFTHMGIDPYALTSALNGVWAQRLMRTICTRCAADYHPDDSALALAGLSKERVRDFQFRFGRGCGDCRGTGYKGRKAIAEILTLNDRLRELIATQGSIAAIKAEAVRGGTRFLRDAALDLVAQGETTLEEVTRVTLQA